jgi:hypothetical protein
MATFPQQTTIHPNSHVGFDSITSQIERKLLKRGFQFNVICVGTYAIASAPWHSSNPRIVESRLS